MVEDTSKTSSKLERDEKGRLLPGQQSLNPNGRPAGKTMKEFAREYFTLKTEEEKKAYVEMVESKKPGFAWQMAEGNPANEMDLKSTEERVIRVIRLDE